MSLKSLLLKIIKLPYSYLKKVYNLFVPSLKLYYTNKNYRMRADYGYLYDKSKIKDNLILYEAYHGRSISGNPYAIYKQLLNDPNFKDFKHVWVVDTYDNPSIKEVEHNPNTSFVKIHSKEYLKVLVKAKYLINNTSFGHYFQKKEGQIYINTWHGTPLKTLGKDVKSSDITGHKNIQRNFLHVDYFISPNKYTVKHFFDSLDIYGLYEGKIIDTGYPRIDLTLNTDPIYVKNKLGIPQEKKIILYAPTWRGTSVTQSLDASERLLHDVEYLNANLPEEYIVLLKVHMYDYKYLKEKNKEHLCVPNHIDTNELLSAVDILITDYSSIFFDFLPTKRPILFYMFDSEEYEKDRGFYFDLNQLPGPKVKTVENLLNRIINIKDVSKEYLTKYEAAINLFSYRDDGNATKRVIDIIFYNKESSHVYKIENNKKKILMYCGGFYNNGITISALNLSKYLDYDKYDLTIVDFGNKNAESTANIKKLDPRTRVIFRPGAMNMRITESYRHYFVIRKGLYKSWVRKIAPINLYKKELKRIIGDAKFDVVIDFGGYNGFWALLFAMSDIPRKGIFMHSDMQMEYDKVVNGKYKHRKNLRLIFSLYKYFHRVVSVAESTNQTNYENFKHLIDNAEEKMVFVNNAIDYKKILEDKEIDKKFIYDDKEYLIVNERNDFGSFITHGVLYPSKEDINFVNIGRLSPEKDQEKLILAFNEVLKMHSNKNLKLYIIGGGVLEEHLKSLVKKLSLEENVIFTGHLNNPYGLMNKCDCVVFSSNYEGQGLVILEALVLNKPIIATDVTGVRSVLKLGSGLLVENSVKGLVDGMNTFIEKGIPVKEFDGKAYTDAAMEMYYEKIFE